jgi:hypothetical protein
MHNRREGCEFESFLGMVRSLSLGNAWNVQSRGCCSRFVLSKIISEQLGSGNTRVCNFCPLYLFTTICDADRNHIEEEENYLELDWNVGRTLHQENIYDFSKTRIISHHRFYRSDHHTEGQQHPDDSIEWFDIEWSFSRVDGVTTEMFWYQWGLRWMI